MPSAADLAQQTKDTMLSSFSDGVQHLPNIAGALLLLLAGWLVARLVYLVVTRLLEFLNRFLERVLTGRSRAMVRFSTGITRLVAGVLFWITLIIFITAATRIAGLSSLAGWLEQIVIYLPSLISGGIIILVGYILSSLAKDTVLAAAQSAELNEAKLIARLAQAATFLTALIIGLNQLGIDVSFLTLMLGVSTASLLIGFAIAFGLGAKTLVSNLVAAHYLREQFEPGQKVRIGEQEGTVLEVSSTALIIDTAAGRTSIPANRSQQETVTLIMEESDNG